MRKAERERERACFYLCFLRYMEDQEAKVVWEQDKLLSIMCVSKPKL